MRAIDLRSVNQQQMERNCHGATRVNGVEQKSLEAEESQLGDKGETLEKTIVLVSKKSAETFEISGGRR